MFLAFQTNLACMHIIGSQFDGSAYCEILCLHPVELFALRGSVSPELHSKPNHKIGPKCETDKVCAVVTGSVIGTVHLANFAVDLNVLKLMVVAERACCFQNGRLSGRLVAADLPGKTCCS